MRQALMLSRYGLRVLGWNPQPGKPLPLPRISDDRALFAEGVVRDVLAWLKKRQPEFERDRTPTDITIRVAKTIDGHKAGIQTKSKLMVKYGKIGDRPEQIGTLYFDCATYELLLKDQRRKLTAKFTYLVARDQDGRAICGPYLRHEQVGPLVLLAS